MCQVLGQLAASRIRLGYQLCNRLFRVLNQVLYCQPIDTEAFSQKQLFEGPAWQILNKLGSSKGCDLSTSPDIQFLPNQPNHFNLPAMAAWPIVSGTSLSRTHTPAQHYPSTDPNT